MKSLSQLIELQSKWLNGKDTLAPILSKNLLKNFCLRAVPWGVHWVDRWPNVVMWWYCVRSHTNILALRNPTQPTKSLKIMSFVRKLNANQKCVFKKNSPEISPGFHTQLEVVKNKIDFSKIKNQYFLKHKISRHEPRLKSPNLQGFLPIPNRVKVRAVQSSSIHSLQGVVEILCC